MIILKSFNSAHEAIHWLSVNPIEGASIETTPVLKSIGSRESKLSNGNYHVVLKNIPHTPVEDIPKAKEVFYRNEGEPYHGDSQLGKYRITESTPEATIQELRGPQTGVVTQVEAQRTGHVPRIGRGVLPLGEEDVVSRTRGNPDGTTTSQIFGNDVVRRNERAAKYIKTKEAQQQQRQPTGLLARMRNLFGKSVSDEEIIKSIVENVVKSILK